MKSICNLEFNEDLTKALIIFLHIPRTGGTSLINLLNSKYTKILRSVDNSEVDKKLRLWIKKEQTFPEVICGHFNMSADIYHTLKYPKYVHITLLRDPVERVISQIYYLQHNPSHMYNEEIQGVDIQTIYKSPELITRYAISNHQTHVLSGYIHQIAKRGIKLNQAILRLRDDVTFFGFTKDIDDFVRICHNRLGWEGTPEVFQLNGFGPQIYDEVIQSEQDLQLIKLYNKDDLEFYKYAQRLYSERFGPVIVDLKIKYPLAVTQPLPEPEVEPEVEPEAVVIEKDIIPVEVKLTLWQRVKNILFYRIW